MNFLALLLFANLAWNSGFNALTTIASETVITLQTTELESLKILHSKINKILDNTRLLETDKTEFHQELDKISTQLLAIDKKAFDEEKSNQTEQIHQSSYNLRLLLRNLMLKQITTTLPLWKKTINDLSEVNDKISFLCPDHYLTEPLLNQKIETLKEAINELSLAIQYKDLSFIRYQLQIIEEINDEYTNTTKSILKNCE